MAMCPHPASAPPLSVDESVEDQVLSSFPFCDLNEDDLAQNPMFARLLSTLSQQLDETGLSVQVKKELQKAEREIHLHKMTWLRSESLFRLVQELLQEYHLKKQDVQISEEDKKFYETLEQCLLVTQCSRELDPSSTTARDKPSLLGLSKENVLSLLPPEKEIKKMKLRLVKEIEDHLKKKCFNILCFYQPDWEGESESMKTVKSSRLPEYLENESKRLESLKQRKRENTILLQKQTHCYLNKLLACLNILQTLILVHRLQTQNELDRKKTQYLEAKCQIMILKIRMEMVKLQMDIYTPKKIAVHRTIRNTLESALMSEKMEHESLERKLSSFEILGQDFEALVKEYSTLRQSIENKKWALQEFSQYSK
ncbi:HAUS augmin-like complex subunit 4 [Polypterus senegalus]|uniref:HAUS augmin-like complex subunit 4 n=1 Tax=Polypterus senegalus TaxID=55291 RepID=UPI001966356C|nr:HAUS augmin-like complex subunit 4 [Polypterus senegalus]